MIEVLAKISSILYFIIKYTVHSKCINDHTLRSDKFESQHSLSPTIWSDVRVDIKRFFFTFLEVNMSNILWSMRICKRTFWLKKHKRCNSKLFYNSLIMRCSYASNDCCARAWQILTLELPFLSRIWCKVKIH
jgi:hypothetical protein